MHGRTSWHPIWDSQCIWAELHVTRLAVFLTTYLGWDVVVSCNPALDKTPNLETRDYKRGGSKISAESRELEWLEWNQRTL